MKPKISYFKVFGCKCFIHNNGKDNLDKFDPRSDEGIFVGYSSESKAYRVFNKRTLTIEESFHVTFVESNPLSSIAESDSDDDIPNSNHLEIVNET